VVGTTGPVVRGGSGRSSLPENPDKTSRDRVDRNF
jgi:hypothetical protein